MGLTHTSVLIIPHRIFCSTNLPLIYRMKLCGSVFEKILKEKKPQLHEHLVGLYAVCDKCYIICARYYLRTYIIYVRILCGNGALYIVTRV